MFGLVTCTWVLQRRPVHGAVFLARRPGLSESRCSSARSSSWKLSKDGSTLTDYYREFESDGSTLSLDYVYQRTGGGSGFAADWRSIKEIRNSPPLLMQVKEFQGGGLSFITPSEQQTKNVKFDGKEYPSEGPNADRPLRPRSGGWTSVLWRPPTRPTVR
jgi:hypothetical protein